MPASMWWKTFRSMCANGSVLRAVPGMTAIAMPPKIFWPRGSRLLPVEGVEDIFERKLVGRLPLKQEPLNREDEKPVPEWQGEMSLYTFYLVNHNCSTGKIDNRDQEEYRIAEVIGHSLQHLQKDAAEADPNDVRENAHCRPDAQELSRLVGRWQSIGDECPVDAGVGAVADAEKDGGDKGPGRILQHDKENAHDGHHSACQVDQSLAPPVVRHPARDNRGRQRGPQQDGEEDAADELFARDVQDIVGIVLQEIKDAPDSHHYQQASEQNPGEVGIARGLEEELAQEWT